MALFKEIPCAHCGNKTTPVIRTKLLDGSYVCNSCTSQIPSYIRSCLSGYDRDSFQQLKQYMSETSPVIKSCFHQTHSFHGLHLDAEHGYFYLDSGMLAERVYLRVENVTVIDLQYDPEKYKEGMLSNKVTGAVHLTLEVDFPAFRVQKKLADGVKAEANLKKGIFSDKVKYDNPKGMDSFMEAFRQAHDQFLYRNNHF